ncbi:nuclear transport factor 2 family protein [Streptomyces griseorubiginosus]|uniref:nuclear transport factor 2 family protein n=1 Tax=Streptomyces griseorubiginosus TaxID=67304 RepID=UPI001AD61281|nr:nuclear transport factor 2 family protein [Streptomyces griseorubiginosus]MBO4252319.1 hypothetical protein [Streptomyces griseorubiginosus]
MDATNDDRDELMARARRQVWIDDPTAGFVDADTFEAESLIWPDERWSSVVSTHRFSSEKRDVWEYVYTRETSEPLQVPVAVVWDKTNEDLRARVYYDKGHFGLTEPRRPIVGPENEPLPEELEAYHIAVSTGDRAAMEKVFHPDATFMSPIGPVSAQQAIAAFSSPEFGGPNGPGVPLQLCTVTPDGTSYAAEIISWRRPPHAALGIYTFREGRLVDARVYEGPVRR